MTNLAKRIIPCLDIKDGRVVKGINFVGLKDAGNPIEIAKRYNDAGADELIFLDINATHEARKTTLHVIESIAKKVFIPLTVGGGISTLQDISNLLDAGCDKVSLNSSALKNPSFIDEAAKTFGSQCVVIAIDAKLRRELQEKIKRVQKELKITTIFVTHDQDEAMIMSDKIHLMKNGIIEQSGNPVELYTHPVSKFAAEFIGHYNILDKSNNLKI